MNTLFGVSRERIDILAARHIVRLAGIHAGAMTALAEDPDISPQEMMALTKWQLLTGLMSAIASDPARRPAAEVVIELQRMVADG